MKEKTFPRILVCTVNAWNDKVGDNTFPLLLEGYDKSCLASLFIREECPDSPVCDTYFRISEQKVMESIFKRGVKTGQRVAAGADAGVPKPKQYANRSRLYYTKLFCRELMWKLGKVRTKELDAFIEEFRPDIVLYEMSRYMHLNNLVRYILKKTGALGVGCFWDDTFTYKQEKTVGYKCLRFFQRRNLKKLARNTGVFFAITPKTKREADAFFGIDCTVLTKPLLGVPELSETEYALPLRMLYTGNVGIGRLEVIKQIVEALKDINGDGVKITIDVYTNTPVTDGDADALNTAFSQLHPPVSQGEVVKLQQAADVLLFVESLKEDKKIARLSFSTKITDYYSAGKCIFAVGNGDLAPMELLCDTDSAICVTESAELSSRLALLLDFEKVREYAEKAVRAGIQNHRKDDILRTFRNTVADAYAKGRNG